MAPAGRKRTAGHDNTQNGEPSPKRAKQAGLQQTKGKTVVNAVLQDGDVENGVTATAAAGGQPAGTVSNSAIPPLASGHGHPKSVRTHGVRPQKPVLRVKHSDAPSADESRFRDRKRVDESPLGGDIDGQDHQQAADSNMDLDPAADAGAPETLPAVLMKQLQRAHDLSDMRIISSSKIETKVTQLMDSLSRINMLDRSSRPGLVVLHADSKAANKLISVVEIAKRSIEQLDKSAASTGGRGGHWYQYTQLDSKLAEVKPRAQISPGAGIQASPIADRIGSGVGSRRRDGATAGVAGMATATQRDTAAADVGGEAARSAHGDARALDEDEGGEGSSGHDGEDDFEAMDCRSLDGGQGRHAEDSHEHQDSGPVPDKHGQPTVRAVPVLSIFLSRVRVPELEAIFG